MKSKLSKWFEVTLRYYNPSQPTGMTVETIALEAESFISAQNRARSIYRDYVACEILSITPALYQDVLFSEKHYSLMHWFLVELEEDNEMVREYYQYLKDSGCNCSYLGGCPYTNTKCQNAFPSNAMGYELAPGRETSVETVVSDESNDNDQSSCNCACNCNCNCDACEHSPESEFNEFSLHGNFRSYDYLHMPSYLRYTRGAEHKSFLLVQGRDFAHVLQRVKEYLQDSVIDFNIFAVVQTQLSEVILDEE